MTYAAYNPDRSPRHAVSREEWLKARKSLLEHEKELTRLRDKISAERRKLPWVKVEKNYVFDTPEGKDPARRVCSAAAASSPFIISC